MAPWAELGAPAVQTAPSGDRRWRSAPARHSESTPVGALESAVRQEEWALPAAELVEQRAPEVLEASGPVPPAAAAEDEAGTAALSLLVLLDLPLMLLLLLLRVLVPRPGVAASRSRSHLPLLVLNLPAFTLGVDGSIDQLVEVVETVVHERVLQVVIQSLPEALLLIAVIGDLSGGVASELEEMITVLGHRHSS
jgi:hypothetical protein